MNKTDHLKLIYTGKYALPLDTATKRSYKIVIFRSNVFSGIIKKIDIPELPENYFILNASDIKGKNSFKINGSKIPILANKTVNYIGEPILILLGLEINVLKTLYAQIKIEYQELEKDNTEEVVFYSKSVNLGKPSEAFTHPYKLISGSIKTPNSIPTTKFLHGSFTKRDSDSITVYSSSVWEGLLRENIASLSSMDIEKIKIISPVTTGEDEYPLIDSFRAAIFTSISAAIIKKNVLYVPTPEDQYLYFSKVYGIDAQWKIAFDESNIVQGINIDIKLNSGAYPVMVQEKVLRIIHGITSYYKFRNISINVIAIKSSSPPCGITSSMYLSDAQFISEILISKIVKESGENQYTWRLNNLLKKGFKSSLGSIIKSDIPLETMLTNVVKQSDFLRKNSSINLSLIRNDKKIHQSTKRGIGISIGYNGNSFISNSKEIATNSVVVQLNKDEKVDLKVSCRLNNLEFLSLWENLISETLNINKENITIYTEDCSLLSDSGPNIENKNVTIITPMIRQCCEDIKVRRFKDPLPIQGIKTTRKKSSIVWNHEIWKGNPFKLSSFAACAVEVEIDKRSLNCIIKEVWIQIEVGQILDRDNLIKSINKEIIKTINWLQEPEPMQKNGEFLTHNFYNKPNIEQKPKINITIHETGKNKNIPKGVGSLIRNSLPSAYLQGINQALGSNINMFPINKDMVFKELRKDEI